MRIAVLGPGGVGGFVAGALARAGADVTVVAREETAAAIAGRGLDVRSVLLGDFVARPAAVAVLEEPVDALLVATKAGGLDAALDRVHGEPGLVVPLLNGLDHMAVLRERFGPERVAAGTIRIEADRPAPGQVVHTSRFLRVDLAADGGRLGPELEALAAALEAAEVPARIMDTEAAVLWGKLVRLNALACTTSAYDLPLGPIRSTPELRADLVAAVQEAAAVARAEGASVEPGNVMGELTDAHAELSSSMRRDIAAGREPELDQIPGAVLRAAARHGLACPTIARLTLQVARRAGIEPPAAALG
ncbi:MAG: 2-dehydropantoate 2-reductase [Solirubrobacteraceae bacterium]|jgi:2-dehydropantoate 2-reductase|nr:2-dehydropantoate 2-reductase [Solirubrobacteraceae bacterium]